MNIARNFLLIGSLYLFAGILMGMYMGGSGDHSQSLLHAHINLLGFTLAAIFGITYRIFPEMAEGQLGFIHFWVHQVGSFILFILLYLLLSGQIDESAMAPVAPISELLILIGIGIFIYNILARLN